MVILLGLMPSPIKSLTLPTSIQHMLFKKPSLKVRNSAEHFKPSKFSDITLYNILAPVTELSTAGLSIPYQACLHQSQKRAFTGETGFSACHCTPHQLHLGKVKK